MMLSVLVPLRNTPQLAAQCLSAMLLTFRALALQCEFILVDDCSDADCGIGNLMLDFRRQMAPAPVRIVQLLERSYFTYACALGLSLARGDAVLMVSHDMLISPAYVRMLLEVAAMDGGFGIVRGCSPYIDYLPQHVYGPPAGMPHRTYEDVLNFSEYAGKYWGNRWEEDEFLIADSFLVRRAVLEKVGVLDTRFEHVLGDVEYGLRVRRAGFRLVCAKGAWLHHEGGAYSRHEIAAGRLTAEQLAAQSDAFLKQGFDYFREKWDQNLPPHDSPLPKFDFPRLVQQPGPAAGFSEFSPPLRIDPQRSREL